MAEELIKLDQWGSIAKLNNGGGIIMPFVQELFYWSAKLPELDL